MSGYQVLQSHVRSLNQVYDVMPDLAYLKSGYHEIPKLDAVMTNQEVIDLDQELKKIGASVKDFRVTVGSDGLYLARPCLTKDEKGAINIFFHPDCQAPFPESAVVLKGSSVVLGEIELPIRKLDNAPMMLSLKQLDKIVETKGSGGAKFKKAMDFLNELGVEFVEVEWLRMECSISPQGYQNNRLTIKHDGKVLDIMVNNQVRDLISGLELCRTPVNPLNMITLFKDEWKTKTSSGIHVKARLTDTEQIPF